MIEVGVQYANLAGGSLQRISAGCLNTARTEYNTLKHHKVLQEASKLTASHSVGLTLNSRRAVTSHKSAATPECSIHLVEPVHLNAFQSIK